MVKQCTSMSTRNFLVLTMWLDRLQKHKEKFKLLTIMVRREGGIVTSLLHFIKNSMPSLKALQIMAIVEWTMAQRSTTFSKALQAMS